MTERPTLPLPRVVYRDAQLLVLDKPAGLPTTSPDGKNCLASLARELDPAAPRMHPSSRLDAEVTGLVTFARTEAAIQHLLAARRAHAYQRFYLGLSARAPEPAQGQWSWAIAKDARDPRKRTARKPGTHGASEALSRYRVLVQLEAATLLLLRPETGRTHQLRVHSAAAGVPLLGDGHYGGATRVVLGDGRVLRPGRVMLHCARLSLPSATGGGPLELEAAAPGDMRELFEQLGGNAAQLSAADAQAIPPS